MGWGYGRRWGYGYSSRQPGKKATAASLSVATLQRIAAQKKAEEEATARYYAMAAQRRADAEKMAAEEARLEALHGGKEGLAKWRLENAAKIQAERLEKEQAARKAAAEKKVVDEMAELRTELAYLPQSEANLAPDCTSFELMKAQVKAAFHLTDKDLEALPKRVIMKEGAKRPSKILWSSKDIFEAVARKEGKKKLRSYQAAYNPQLGRKFVEDELLVLEGKHPELAEKGRLQTVQKLREADDAAIAQSRKAEEAVEAAIRALEAARDKQRRVRLALRETATVEEVAEMKLFDPLEDEDDEEVEPSAPPESGVHATLSKSEGKRPISRTPLTGATGANKKARVVESGPSSASGSLDVD
jgi:hypothetical protein